MPFLVDSVMTELAERHVGVKLVAHPVVSSARDVAGRLTMFGAPGPGVPGNRESFIHVHVDRIHDEAQRNEIISALGSVLADVRRIVEDWKPMLGRVRDVIADLKANPPPIPVDEIAEAIQFLEWLTSNNFTLLGVRDYQLTGGETDYEPHADGGLGLLRDRNFQVLRRGNDLAAITPEIMEFLREPKVLIIAKANVRSRIHRRVYLDYIGRQALRAGWPPDRRIPDRRAVHVDGLHPSGPRHSLSAPQGGQGIAPRRVRTGRTSRQGARQCAGDLSARRAVSDRRRATLRFRASDPLSRRTSPRARADAPRPVSTVSFPFSSLCRASATTAQRMRRSDNIWSTRITAGCRHFIRTTPKARWSVSTTSSGVPAATRRKFRAPRSRLPSTDIVRTWTDKFENAVTNSQMPARARDIISHFRTAFSASYREAYSPDIAVDGHQSRLKGLSAERPLAVSFHRGNGDEEGTAALKVWSYDKPIPLSERVPVLENMGFRIVDEHTYHVTPTGPAPPITGCTT